MNVDFEKIRKATESDILYWCERLAPSGKQHGKEYTALNPTRADSNAGSFKINVNTGVWKDFSSDEAGGDMIALYAYVNNCSQAHAAIAIAEHYGIAEACGITPQKGKKKIMENAPKQPKTPKKIPDIKVFTPILPETHKIPPIIKSLGKPTSSHKYPHGWVLRFDPPNGRKEFRGYHYGELEKIVDGVTTKEIGWHWVQMADPRPLYNLDKPVEGLQAYVIVEGEKAADTLHALIDGKTCGVTTWACGTGNWSKADWTPLYNTRVILWADNDEGGIKAMEGIAAHLHANGCKIKMVDVSQFPEKYDAHDYCQDHDRTTTLNFLAKSRVYTPPPPPVEEAPPEKIYVSRVIDLDRVMGKRFSAPQLHESSAEEQPYFILGFADRYFYFYSRATETALGLPSRELTESGLVEMFPNLDHWEKSYPVNNGKPNWSRVREMLIKACVKKGRFDPSRIRKTGAWIDNDEIVVHMGDKMYMGDKFVKPSDVLSEFIYEGCLPIKVEQVAIVDGKKCDYIPEAMSDETAQEIMTLFQSIKFDIPEASILIAGFTAFLPICGIAEHRPHMWIVAPPSSGKSDLVSKIIGRLVKDMAIKVVPPATEPGLRREINGTTLPVIFDESESETDKSAGVMQEVLALCRRSSTETEGKSLMGKAGSTGTESFQAHSSFLLASIISTLKTAADKSRFTILSMSSTNYHEARKHFRNVIEPMRERLITKENCNAFLLRSVKNASTILHNIGVLQDVMEDRNMGGRTAKQYAPMLAGAYLYKTTAKITQEEAIALVSQFDFTKFYEPDTTPSEEEDIFMFLLSVPVTVKNDPSASTRTIGWLIGHILDSEDAAYMLDEGRHVMPVSTCHQLLKERGIKVDLVKDKLLLCIGSREIKNMFRHNPQWDEWHLLLLRRKGIFARLRNDEDTRDAMVSFSGLKRGYAVYCTLDFLRNGVSFSEMRPSYIEDTTQDDPF